MGRTKASVGQQAFTPPAELDGFRVIRPLGRGGMGHVYLGHDDMLDRAVALKFLAAADPRSTARERFLVEARAIARLQHPNVVGIFRVGEALGHTYLAYELVSGRSLDRIPRPVPWQRALDLALGVARGLAAAHRRDVLHRDVKPANVMLADSGDIKLIDFGLAKLLDGPRRTLPPPSTPPAPEGPDPALLDTLEGPDLEDAGPGAAGHALTVTGALMGTPLYMAPELWRGEPATAQADVYALGLILYELLSGRAPHEGLYVSELAHAVLTRDPPPIRSVCPTVPEALAGVVDCCLRRRRQERYATAEEAREALEAIRALYQPFDDAGTGPASAEDEAAVLVSASFARVAPRADAFSARMYERLFARHPAIRPLFPADMSAQRRKLFGALHVIVDNLRRPERLVPLLEDLGRRHAAYGVKPEHLDAVGEALIGAIADHDAGFGDATAAAWEHAYARIAEAMGRGLAGELPTAPPGSLRRATWEEQELEPPRTRYCRSGEVNLAYQVLGSGSLDLVLVIGWLTHLEIGWQWPARARFLRSLAGMGRLIVFDARGTGLSDPVGPDALVEERSADLRAVMDAAGAERAAIIGLGAGVATAVFFAATHPERARALVLYGGGARAALDPDAPAAVRDQIRASWGEPLFLDRLAPSMAGDEAFRRWWARFLRMSASPGVAMAHHQAAAAADVRALLPAVRAPALVLHRALDRMVDAEEICRLADRIPGATLVALPGVDHLPFVGDTGALVDEVRDFLRGPALQGSPAGETSIVSAVVALLPRGEADHEARDSQPPAAGVRLLVEREIARFRGVELDGPGPGRAAAMFEGPMRAVRFARSVLARVRAAGVGLAAGVCFDECLLDDAEVGGAAVRLAPLVAARAQPGEVVVTATVRSLLASSGLVFEERGVCGADVELYAVLPDPG